jgi:hypothetical protein
MKFHNKCKFSEAEDQLLVKLVELNGTDNWKLIASEFPFRSIRQLRERWRVYLSPCFNKGPFTPEEDQIIIEGQSKFGNSWKNFSQFLLPNRTDIAIRNRFRQIKKDGVERRICQIDFFNFKFDELDEDFLQEQNEFFSFL